MRRLLAACLTLASVLTAVGAAAATLAITHVTVIDATGSAPQPDMTIIVKQGRIVGLGKSTVIQSPAMRLPSMARANILIPGLWDMHVHTVFGDWLPRNEKVVLPLFVANGVTGVRDMGGDLDVLKVWRSSIAAGRLLGRGWSLQVPCWMAPCRAFRVRRRWRTPRRGARWSMI